MTRSLSPAERDKDLVTIGYLKSKKIGGGGWNKYSKNIK